MPEPLLVGAVELAAALGVRPHILTGYLTQPGPTVPLCEHIRGEVERDHGVKATDLPFLTQPHARAMALFLALWRAGETESRAAALAPLALALLPGPLPGRLWVRLDRGRVDARHELPGAWEGAFTRAELAGVEEALAAVFREHGRARAEWLALGYHGARLVEPERPALPPAVLKRLAAPDTDEDRAAALLGAKIGGWGSKHSWASNRQKRIQAARKPRVVVVPGPGERDAPREVEAA